MVSRQGELHSHVLAIFSSHALQLLWIFDVHRLRIKDFKEFLCFRPRIFALSNGVHNLPNLHHLHLHLLHISRSCCSLRHLAVFVSLSLSAAALAQSLLPCNLKTVVLDLLIDSPPPFPTGARKFWLSFGC